MIRPERMTIPKAISDLNPTRVSVTVARAEKIWCRDGIAVVRLTCGRWWTSEKFRFAYPFMSWRAPNRHRAETIINGLRALGVITPQDRDQYLAASREYWDNEMAEGHLRWLRKEAAEIGMRLTPKEGR